SSWKYCRIPTVTFAGALRLYLRETSPEGSNLKQSGDEPDDRLLVEAAQKDPTRFADLYERHFERVYAFIVRRVGNRHDAQDLTADVFHQALAKLHRVEWRGAPFGSWLLRIAANAVTDRARRTRKQQPNPGIDALEGKVEPEASELAEVEEAAKLFRLVQTLP